MINNKTLFHIHTTRCGHAYSTDIEFIEKAIILDCTDIYFTEHGPFENNYFPDLTKRMAVEIAEYTTTLQKLKNKYSDQINIHFGLEMEYLPRFDSWYPYLLEHVEFLILGQHIFENEQGEILFPSRFTSTKEFATYANSISQALDTGYFKILAHPERVFAKGMKNGYADWGCSCIHATQIIRESLLKNKVPAEFNVGSFPKLKNYNEEVDIFPCKRFWDSINRAEIPVVVGLDAHSADELRDDAFDQTFNYAKKWFDDLVLKDASEYI